MVGKVALWTLACIVIPAGFGFAIPFAQAHRMNSCMQQVTDIVAITNELGDPLHQVSPAAIILRVCF